MKRKWLLLLIIISSINSFAKETYTKEEKQYLKQIEKGDKDSLLKLSDYYFRNRKFEESEKLLLKYEKENNNLGNSRETKEKIISFYRYWRDSIVLSVLKVNIEKTKELEELEEHHREKLQEFEERNDYFQTACRAIQNILDEKYEETLHYLRTTDADQDFYGILNREMESYQILSEDALMQAQKKLELEFLKENDDFRRERRYLDDELEAAYLRRRIAADDNN